jgi:serine protease Do
MMNALRMKLEALWGSRVKRLVGALALVLIGVLVGSAITARTEWSPFPSRGGQTRVPIYLATGTPVSGNVSLLEGLAPIVRAAREWVVTIETRIPDRAGWDPFDDPFFRWFFGRPQVPRQERYRQGLGSGVIVSPDGYILTNHHVVENASELTVVLFDGRRFSGRIVGTDQKTDLAVIKIDATKLPSAVFGDSSRVQAGDFVIAIGSPFSPQLQHTVTFGIVSATGRGSLGIADYGDFIQTDAAINPGNSGGPLVNMRGELIGINTAIFTRGAPANAGVGFAIPINMAREVMDRILKYGRVVRGYLGVNIQTLDDAMAEVYGAKGRRGAIVLDVVPDSPADRAGLRRDDIIVEYNGRAVTGSEQLRNMVALTAPGTRVTLKILREGREQTLTVEVGELKEERAGGQWGEGPERGATLSGIEVQELTPAVQRRYDIPRQITGVLIVDLAPGSPAAEAGLMPGDVIQEINRQPIRTVADFRRMVADVGRRRAVLRVYSQRQGGSLLIVLEPRG